MGRFVIVAYAPKPGMTDALLAAVRKHLQVLRAENLVTDRPAYVMRAADGTVVEIFEWQSNEAIEKAHSTPVVQALWAEFDAQMARLYARWAAACASPSETASGP